MKRWWNSSVSGSSAANDRNQFVGQAKNGGGNYRAFLWIPGQLNLKDLNDYLSTSQAATWTLNAAYGISDSGRIVLWATKTSGGTTYQRAVILYPN